MRLIDADALKQAMLQMHPYFKPPEDIIAAAPTVSCERCQHWDEEWHYPAITPRIGECALDVRLDNCVTPEHFGCPGFKEVRR